MQRRFRN